jgi:hypothetical protein
LWIYLAPEIQGLVSDGEILIDFVLHHKKSANITDFSFLVFPFAKAYEGFLKKVFLDVGMIQPHEYYSDDIRIGRILNPHYETEKGNVYATMSKHSEARKQVSEELWQIWKRGRNAVFHYFPHNFKRLDYQEALELIQAFIHGMEIAVENFDVHKDTTVVHTEDSPDAIQQLV